MVIISSASLYEIMNFRFLSSGLVDSYMKWLRQHMRNITKINSDGDDCHTMTAANLRILPSFSSILMKSFFGGWGISERQDCLLSSREPKPLYGGSSCNYGKMNTQITEIVSVFVPVQLVVVGVG